MQMEIVSRIAELVRNPNAEQKARVEKTAEKGAPAPVATDRAEISAEARATQESLQQVESQYEKARMERLASVQARVDAGTYRLSADMVDQIAKQIVEII